MPILHEPDLTQTPQEVGLTSQQAADLLAQVGPNDPSPRVHRGEFLEFLRLFFNPLVIILLIASAVAAFLGELINAGLITGMVLVGVGINFIQTYRSRRAVEMLRARVAPTATALRDGSWREIHRSEIVPGDLVRLSAGDLVPADSRIVLARDLFVQQAALTGESMPVDKETLPRPSDLSAGPAAPDLVFLGTSVVSGTALARVLVTGPRTAFGSIAERLAMRPEETEFERGLRLFGLLIMRTVFFLVLFILVLRVALHKDALESLIFAVALAVGLTPEFLPMITSVTLARGAVRMAQAKVIVKHLSAIQNLGSIDVLCSDKTGTLTRGEMSLEKSLDAAGQPADRPLLLAWLNSKFETGIRSPLDATILLSQVSHAEDYSKRDEIPFDFERRRLSIVVDQKSAAGSRHLLITKGAPEGILPLCVSCESAGQPVPMDAAARDRSSQLYQSLCADGFRVLAVAWREVQLTDGLSVQDERELTLAGFLAFSDPLRDDAAAAVQALARDGVQLKILTGDNELVARHVCKQLGIADPPTMLGEELERTSDAAIGHVAEQTMLFARISPTQKHRIILALKHRSHVAGYIGDGINDAPSLHAADVGISVSTAVDIARDAADIILVEPGLSVLHRGILEGRKASANVLKYLLMGTSSNFGNMFSMAAASLFLPFLPMLPFQILLNNFLYDLAQVTIPTDNVEDIQLRSPQRWDLRLIRNFMIFIGPVSSLYDFLTFYVLLAVFHAGETLFHTGWFVESLATQTLVLFVIRTMGNPLRSRPSLPLTLTTLFIVLVGILLPFSPVAHTLGLTPLPAKFFAFLAFASLTYLALVELVKRRLFAAHAVASA
ncbi:MAG: magnesium-translocating P-type ATPase [Acidobacteriia bacterium]|nr:magnesium-translocating P-type ATPase [Terriglobia bacterium]